MGEERNGGREGGIKRGREEGREGIEVQRVWIISVVPTYFITLLFLRCGRVLL